MKLKNLLMTLTAAVTLGTVGTLSAQASASSSQPVYRLYNKFTGEHFYTENAYEKDVLANKGWRYEGIGWQTANSGTPVYRVYNPNAKGGDHYYTMSRYEAQSLVNKGWRWDNNGKAAFYSAGNTNLYVAYNPNAQSGAHNYTTNTYEQNSLLGKGWRYGKVAWKTMGNAKPSGGNTGGTVTPSKPYRDIPGADFKVDELISPNTPHKETINQLPAKASSGVTAEQIALGTGISSYEGIPNIAYDSVGITMFLFGAGSPRIAASYGESIRDAVDDFISMFDGAYGPLTISMVNAAIDFQGLPASAHITHEQYPWLKP
ncbi:hypothetical protein [Lactococcus lactis]|uniref:DUF5648 domain-containing protein n=1 Tax=Lactococcus lactis TaxID=1358 RepID=A0AAW5TMJ8_9LACT|nr:hypothetical protein [Lactococcus lactis]MCW2281196.1 hypothetical protein [Lactococcus lactis]